jgi:hypothetical protein
MANGTIGERPEGGGVFVRATKLVDLTSDPDRASLWCLEVCDAGRMRIPCLMLSFIESF